MGFLHGIIQDAKARETLKPAEESWDFAGSLEKFESQKNSLRDAPQGVSRMRTPSKRVRATPTRTYVEMETGPQEAESMSEVENENGDLIIRDTGAETVTTQSRVGLSSRESASIGFVSSFVSSHQEVISNVDLNLKDQTLEDNGDGVNRNGKAYRRSRGSSSLSIDLPQVKNETEEVVESPVKITQKIDEVFDVVPDIKKQIEEEVDVATVLSVSSSSQESVVGRVAGPSMESSVEKDDISPISMDEEVTEAIQLFNEYGVSIGETLPSQKSSIPVAEEFSKPEVRIGQIDVIVALGEKTKSPVTPIVKTSGSLKYMRKA